MLKQSTLTNCVTVVTLRVYITKTSAKITKIVDLLINTVNRIYARAIARGFDLTYIKISNKYVEDIPRSSRLTK